MLKGPTILQQFFFTLQIDCQYGHLLTIQNRAVVIKQLTNPEVLNQFIIILNSPLRVERSLKYSQIKFKDI